MTVKVSIRILFYSLAFAGLIFQLQSIAIEYLAYKTSTRIELLSTFPAPNPSLVFCVRYNDVLDRSQHEKYGIHFKRHNNRTLLQEEMMRLSVDQIFSLTPNVSDVIGRCTYRHNSYMLTAHSRDECKELFRVFKWFSQEFMCYQIITRTSDNHWDCDKVSVSVYDAGKMYDVELTEVFRGSDEISLISFLPSMSGVKEVFNQDWKLLPTLSRRYGKIMKRLIEFNDINETSRSSFALSHTMNLITYLPPPYDTQCTDFLADYKLECQMTCDKKIYAKYGKVPPDAILLKPTQLKTVVIGDIMNETLMKSISEEKEKCWKNCSQVLCSMFYSMTKSSHSHSQSGNITLTSTCEFNPIHRIVYVPSVPLYEFVVFATSSISLWFGLSFVSLDPYNIRNGIERLKDMKKEKQFGHQSRWRRIVISYDKTIDRH